MQWIAMELLVTGTSILPAHFYHFVALKLSCVSPLSIFVVC